MPPRSEYALDVSAVRRRFPALRQRVGDRIPTYLDNPAGTQVPASVIAAMRDYMIKANANHGGVFHTSVISDRMIQETREAFSDFLGAASPDQIVFGPNMTTLTFNLSRALAHTMRAGDEIVVTRMDHDANISPWLRVAEERGLTVRWVDFDPATGRLDMEQLASLVGSRTRLVACTCASNALGTITDAAAVVRIAHSAGALAFLDAVHYAPHAPIDVVRLDCDFLVCSAYKFFGPHVGVMYGKLEHLTTLPAYRVRPANDLPPERWETGTLAHESLAGALAAIGYIQSLGRAAIARRTGRTHSRANRRMQLLSAIEAIREYEKRLSKRLIEGLGSIEGVTVAGITDPAKLDERTPTVIFTVEGRDPRAVATALARAGIYVWDGNYYALEVMNRLDRERRGGMVRVGAVHYNTIAEIDRFIEQVDRIARSKR